MQINFSSRLIRVALAAVVMAISSRSFSAATPPTTATRLAPKLFGKGLQPAYLRCEYRVNPLGIGETQPRLSWVVESGERAQRQTAYHILVASSATALAADNADLWDSGKVSSSETTGVVYAGKPLPSGQQCFWKLKVWDVREKESLWSTAAWWTMGLLQPSDPPSPGSSGAAGWQAQWIGCDKLRQPTNTEVQFGGAKWIWSGKDAPTNTPAGKRTFLATVTLPAVADIASAELTVAADDRFSINLNGQRVGANNRNPSEPIMAHRLDALRFLKSGVNELRASVENASAGSAGLLVNLTVKTKSGKTITRLTDATWQATDNNSARATNHSAWSGCRVIGEHGIAPWGKLKMFPIGTPPAVYLRTGFTVKQPVVRATLYATALGWFDIHLNGDRVSDDYFNPGWTDYTKRIYYRAYDVTAAVRRGTNAFGAVLSDGWYSGYIGGEHRREHYGSKPRVLAQLVLEFADGSRQVVASGPDWKAFTSPITHADILQGETYDATKEIAGWDTPGFRDKSWVAVDTGAELNPVVQAHPGPPVVAIKEFTAKTINEPKPGVFVFDLGQNFAGVTRLSVRGKAGQRITIRHGERLDPDGTIHTANLRSAAATDVYICKGKGTEVWSPRFTFHGFQYVQVTGLTEKPTDATLVGVALSSDTTVAGGFECSDPMLNQLHNNVYWTQRANFIDIPTDCPQRDERLGWTGDAQIYIRTATLNTDVQAFFTKWLVDLDDAQRADGQFPRVAPDKVAGNDGGPAWADAGVICPWTIYEVYGDKRQLERHYPAMRRFIEFCVGRSTPELLPPAKYHCYGDWVSIKAETPDDLIYTAYFAYSTRLLARSAQALGKTEDAVKYLELFEKIKTAFNRTYVAADGRIKGDTQAAYVLALAFDLVEGETARRAADHLVADIEKHHWHLTTGFVGTKDLMLALAKIGRNDVAYRLVHNDTFPSWGFSIKNGATSIWERWDGWTPEIGFEKSGMNSFAHYSFGAVYGWMAENIGGIRNAGLAYDRILIAPEPDDKLTFARVAYDSIHGTIRSEWKKSANQFTVNVTIPANTTATVSLPAAADGDITENGLPLDQVTGVKFLRMENGRALLAVASGSYTFAVKTAQ